MGPFRFHRALTAATVFQVRPLDQLSNKTDSHRWMDFSQPLRRSILERMPITRKFLGFERPALVSATDYLLAAYGNDRRLDLSDVVIVLPGRRAGRRLLEILVGIAGRRKLLLVPPHIVTVGGLPEELYLPRRPFADEWVQTLAWARVLQQAAAATLRPLLSELPPADETGRWWELAELLRRQHLELAADGLNFQDVMGHAEQLGGKAEQMRWAALAALQGEYLRCLDQLELWDRQTARLVAIQHRECHTSRDILLLGTVDMNVATRKMLDQVAHQVVALVHAPPDWSGGFDEHGCLDPEFWQSLHLEIDDKQIEVVDGPASQAEAVARWMAGLNQRFAADEITVGVADQSLVSDLERRLHQLGVPTRSGAGTPLAQALPVQLLKAIAEFVGQRRFADFANLVRHPDVEAWLEHASPGTDWLAQLDQYYADHLPYRMPNEWLGPPDKSGLIREIASRVTRWLEGLEGRRPLAAWCSRITDLLSEIYADREFDSAQPEQRFTLQSFRSVQATLEAFQAVPDALHPELTSREAITWLVSAVSRQLFAVPAEQAVEMLGWLELPLDDAPALIVTSLNEGFVPQSVNTDLFLPNALRARLGLLDNQRRLARDTYALRVLLHSRAAVQLVIARRNRAGDPLSPSRLVFATDAVTAARRAKEFFEKQEVVAAGADAADSTLARLEIPRPLPLDEPIHEFSVTCFRDYLACPYRFYLRHVLRLRAVDDAAEELDAGAFGALAHEILARFGRSAAKDSTDAGEIRSVLRRELAACFDARYGRQPAPAVLIQAEQLQMRLDAFAEAQADWAAQGWRIAYTESAAAQQIDFDVDGQTARLKGRIDRLDIHPDGRRVILDYKTSDSGATPDQVHRRQGRWIDLQLPLYRRFAESLWGPGAVELGYIVLPKEDVQTPFLLADWSVNDLEAAAEMARDVIRSIRRGHFWPPAYPSPDFSDDFAAICQDRVLIR